MLKNVEDIIDKLRDLGLTLKIEKGMLKIVGPKSVLNNDLHDQIVKNKKDIIKFFDEAKSASTNVQKLDQQLTHSNRVPLSFAQERIWFLDQLFPENPFYNIPLNLHLKGVIDIWALRETLMEIMRRHESLRTRFTVIDEEPVQIIEDEIPTFPSLVDLRNLTETDKKNEAERIVLEESILPFDLRKDLMLRAKLLFMDKEDYIFLLTMHHIASDGWSTGLLQNELSKLYCAYLRGEPSPLEELPIQYADFTVWQRNWLSGEVLDNQLSYWRDQLSGLTPLEIPTDRPRPLIQSHRGDTFPFFIKPELTKRLRAISQEKGVSLYMTLLAAFDVLLSCYSGQEDIAVASPIANRNRKEIEDLIGFFVNTLVMRTDLSGNPTFFELIDRVRRIALDAYSNQDLPFELLVEEFHPERDMSRNPLVQVTIALHNAPRSSFEMANLAVSPIEHGVQVKTSSDIIINLWEFSEGLNGSILYSADLFDSATISGLMRHFVNLLREITTNPEKRLSELSILTEEESQQLLVEWNDTGAEYSSDKCLHELFEEQIEQSSDAVAVVFGENRITYCELNDKANQLAVYLQGLGLNPDGIVGIYMERSVEMVIGLIGVLKSGCAYVPLDPGYPEDRLNFMLGDSQVITLLTQKKFASSVKNRGNEIKNRSIPIVVLDEDWKALATSKKPLNIVTSDNLAYVIYTSGSTGQPKGVMISHKAICNHMFWMQSEFNFDSTDVFFQKTPFSFDASIWEFYAPLLSGGQLIMARPEWHKSVSCLKKEIAEKRITVFQAVPTLFEMMVNEEGLSHSSDDSKSSYSLNIGKDSDVSGYASRFRLENSDVKSVKTAQRPPINDLTDLPILDRSLVRYKKYHEMISMAPAKHSIALQASRGCPYNCLYCHKIWPKKQIFRDGENIFEEILRCHDAGCRRFTFIDDIFNLDKKESRKLLEKIIKHKLKLQLFFPNGLRGDILTEDYIDLLIEAGTVDICVALESASPRIQKLIRKNLNIENLFSNITYITENYPDVIMELQMVLGLPTETEEEANMTLDFLRSIKWIDFPNLNILKIFPNTDMFNFAISNGVSEESIYKSVDRGFHEIPETLPFPKSFVRKYQMRFLTEYFLNRDRLLKVLPSQMKILTENELVQKYNSYLPGEIKTFSDILIFCDISNDELGPVELMQNESMATPDFDDKIKKHFPVVKKTDDAFRVLLLDLSMLFSGDINSDIYDVSAEPLGLMYLLTYLNDKLGEKIYGKIVKSRIDFDGYEDLKGLIDDFGPDVIGIRTISLYKDFFHYTVSKIRKWCGDIPIITGGPYATSEYNTILADENIDIVVLGEGEITFYEIVREIIQSEGKLPGDNVLENIPGITFIPRQHKSSLKAGNNEKGDVSFDALYPNEINTKYDQFGSLKHIFSGGERLSNNLKNRLVSNISAELHNLYGPTEASIDSIFYNILKDTDSEVIPIGRPITNTRVYIQNNLFQPSPVRTPGELHIRGPGLARGYYNHSSLTAEKFIPNMNNGEAGGRLYRTGDCARYLSDGAIEYIDRIDSQVKIRGYRIELGEIESVIQEYPGVKESVVLAREDQPGDKRLVAYITASLVKELDIVEIREYLKAKLPDYMIPSAFVVFKKMPLTANGKIDRKKLPSPERSGLEKKYVAPRSEVEKQLAKIWSEVLGVEKISIHDNFFDLGGHSLLIIKVRKRLREISKKDIKVTDLFQYPTVRLLSEYIHSDLDVEKENEKESTMIRSEKYESIAVIGMACRFPGSKNVEEFWMNLQNSEECISQFSDEELLEDGEDSVILCNPAYVKAGSILEDVELFDAGFFGFSPRDAEITDPQHRLFLECAYEALERAGYAGETEKVSIGIFAGSSVNEYLLRMLIGNPSILANIDGMRLSIGNDNDHLSPLISYKLNLHGPSLNIQTACSTSLVAVHIACQSLLNNECEIAMAGGVSVGNYKKRGYLYTEGGILSPDGHCRAFDTDAKGTAPGSGMGIVVLKRLKDALKDGDHIEAVISGSAINNDGSLRVGYAAPSVKGQASVIHRAQATAGITADMISYVETHGTGTILGDPIELKALTQAFREHTQKKGFCAIGSVKTNIGHAGAAAGVAGFIKTVLALKYKKIPASLHFKKPNPEIDFVNSPFYVNTELKEWESNSNPLRAGVSSFGIGGTNAHVIVEEAPSIPDEYAKSETTSRPYHLISLSARTSSALDSMSDNLVKHLEKYPGLDVSDVAYSLHMGRKSFDYRRAFVCRDTDEILDFLRKRDSDRVFTGYKEEGSKRAIFMFPGQGAQYINMGLNLYNDEQGFRNDVDLCSEILEPQLSLDLRKIIFPSDDDIGCAAEKLKQTAITQPALFVIEYALARLFISWGIKPSAMIGHSIGEYVAACLSGVFSFKDCLKLVALRGRLIQDLPEGKMLAVPLSEEKLKPLLGNGLSIASVNSANQCTVSGSSEKIELLKDMMKDQSVTCIDLHTSHAFHSEMMVPILKEYADHVRKIDRNPPLIPFISSVTGTWITEEDAIDPDYWARHIRHTVRFSDGMREILKAEDQILLEVGPGKTLKTLAMQDSDLMIGQVILNSIRHPHETASDMSFLLATLGRLWVEGVKVDWTEFHRHEERRRVLLPTYPFERQKYWIETMDQVKPVEVFENSNNESFDEKEADIADWFYVPSWKRTILPEIALVDDLLQKRMTWLVFIDEYGVGTEISKKLKKAHQDVITVSIQKEFGHSKENEYALNPAHHEHYDVLLKELQSKSKSPDRIVHCWNVTIANTADSNHKRVIPFQDVGFYSLLFTAQALGTQGVTKEVQITVISNNMQEVVGQDLLYPQKATLLGPVRVIPKEYQNITCKSIDIVIPKLRDQRIEKLIDLLMSELISNPSNSIVAYRGNHRWEEKLEPIRLEDEYERVRKLKEGGIYLITGGLGSMGLAFAEYIAQEVQAKLILIGRSEFPAKEEWKEWLSGSPEKSSINYPQLVEKGKSVDILLEEEIDSIDKLERRIENELGIKLLENYKGLEESLNELCSSYVYDYFKNSNLNIDKGNVVNKEELKLTLKILPAFRKFYDFFIKILTEDDIIRTEGENIVFHKERREIVKPNILAELIADKYPEFKGLLDLLGHCTRSYGRALSGEIPAIGVLYPEGNDSLLQGYGRNTVEHTKQRIYLSVLSETVSKIVKKEKNRKVRILEIGAGSGTLTYDILKKLPGRNIEYYFTDIGKTFVNNARSEASKRNIDFMRFNTFDISKDPEEQGYDKFSFDIILGYNVVHATPSIEATILNLKKLLVPDGMLCLIEPVKNRRWNDMIWGLAEGWWYFSDEDLRKYSPLLNLDTWEEVLRKHGFLNVKAYPEDKQRRRNTDTGLIIAQQNFEDCREEYTKNLVKVNTEKISNKILRLKEIEKLGSEVEVISADVTNEEDMKAVLSIINERFGDLDGIIHTAGILGQGMIYRKTIEETEAVLGPKVKGTLLLQDLVKDKEVDFMILCSSLSSILPLIGQVDYCASNAFLDAFAFYNTYQKNIFTVTIDWGFWQELGMAGKAIKPLFSSEIMKDIKNGKMANAGVRAFSRILNGCVFPQIIFTSKGINIMTEHKQPLNILERKAKTNPKRAVYPRQESSVPYVTWQNPHEHTLIEIMQELFSIQQIGRLDNFLELGGDSLIALQLISRIKEAFGVTLTYRNVFEKSTIADLSDLVETMQLDERLKGVGNDALNKIVEKFDGISNDEIKKRILAGDE